MGKCFALLHKILSFLTDRIFHSEGTVTAKSCQYTPNNSKKAAADRLRQSFFFMMMR